jgi:hypothetical protein
MIPANCNCGAFWDAGSGWVSVSASGAVIGDVGSGTLWVRDRELANHFTVTHYQTKAWASSLSAWKYTGTNISFEVWGLWWVKAQGTGIAESATAQGTATLQGTGKTTLNNGPVRYWPSLAPRSIHLQS